MVGKFLSTNPCAGVIFVRDRGVPDYRDAAFADYKGGRMGDKVDVKFVESSKPIPLARGHKINETAGEAWHKSSSRTKTKRRKERQQPLFEDDDENVDEDADDAPVRATSTRTRVYPTYAVREDADFTAKDKKAVESYIAYRYQIGLIDALLRSLGVVIVERVGWEADDVIARIVAKTDKESKFVVYSGDRDLEQVAFRAGVSVVHPKALASKEEPEWINGPLDHAKMVLRVFMAGKASNNWKGIKGIGPKKADQLIDEFGVDIDDIYDGCADKATNPKSKAIYRQFVESYDELDNPSAIIEAIDLLVAARRCRLQRVPAPVIDVGAFVRFCTEYSMINLRADATRAMRPFVQAFNRFPLERAWVRKLVRWKPQSE